VNQTVLSAALSYPTETGSASYCEKISLIGAALQSAGSVASIAHPCADGDALGSQLALQNYARMTGKQCWTLNFDPLPAQISWLPGADALVDHLPDGKVVDILFLMETTDASRLGDRVSFFKQAHTLIHLDHHPGISCHGNINLLDERASSTCEILYNILKSDSLVLPMDILEPLYVGIMTDTGNFRFSNSTPAAHRIAGEMIAAGLDISRIYKRVYERDSLKRVIVRGLVMSRATSIANGKIHYSWLTEKDFTSLGATEVDSDGCINNLCSIVGMDVAILFRELPDRKIKASFRSNGRIDVQEIAKSFGGGGHKLAASAKIDKPFVEACDLVLKSAELALAGKD